MKPFVLLVAVALLGAGCGSTTPAPVATPSPTPPSIAVGEPNPATPPATGGELRAFRGKGTATVNITGDLPLSGTFPVECQPDLIELNQGMRYVVQTPMREVQPGVMQPGYVITFTKSKTLTTGVQDLSDPEVQLNFTTRNAQNQIVTFEAVKAETTLDFGADLHTVTFKGKLDGMFNPNKIQADITLTCNEERR